MSQRNLLIIATCLAALWAGGLACLAEETPAERGYRTLLTVPFGFPVCSEKQYFDLWQVWPEPLRSEAAKSTPEQRQQMALRRYGFQLSPDRSGPIPQQFTSDGKGGLVTNCLACHGGPVRGQVVRGLGNGLSDLDTLTEDLERQGLAEPIPSPVKVPPTPPAPSRGLNQAWTDATLFVMHRDNDMNLVEKPVYTPTPEQLDIPVRTPPYWWSHKKSRYYADGFVGKSSRDIMQFALHYRVPAATFVGWEEPFKDIFAWINSVQPPPYDKPIDRALASDGRILYVNHCSRCHGTYGPGGSYPQKLVSLDEIGTDSVRARELSPDFKKHLGESWLGNYGKVELSLDKGYIAPPLDGIWAVAPYLHNGSVPTLWHLLTPAKRPAIWRRSDNGYDDVRLGLEITTFDTLPSDVTRPDQQRQYYQSAKRGLGNEGHDFPPAGLDEDEKAALIEYLKTL